jgi:transcriptional regulator with XRE-family HTH domain
MDADDAPAIGQRVRMIRHRRGLSLDVVGGLAGITGAYLSMLERGLRGFNRRGLVEDLAAALGCAVTDLTGQPYLAPDWATVQGRAALPGISLALNEFVPDDVPDVHPRSLDELVAWADSANEHRDQGRYSLGVRVHCVRAGVRRYPDAAGRRRAPQPREIRSAVFRSGPGAGVGRSAPRRRGDPAPGHRRPPRADPDP